MKRFILIFSLAFVTGLAGVASAQEYKETYNAAIAAAEAGNYADAYNKYELAARQAEAEGDTDVAKKAHIVCAKIAKIVGTEAYKAGDFQEALAEFEKGIKHEPEYVPNLYMKGLAQKQLGDIDAAMTTLAEVANGRDQKSARTAAEAIRDYHHAEASKLAARDPLSSPDAQQIRSLIASMQEYGQQPDANSFFYLGIAAKAQGNYDEAVSFADQAIQVHRGSRADQAKLHFLKGESLMLAGENALAKEAFTAAAFGSYKASAEHYLETL